MEEVRCPSQDSEIIIREKGGGDERLEQMLHEAHEQEEDVLLFMDSLDSYLILLDSLSGTLRQGWLELAAARQSMGASRINSSMVDLKYHSAVTSVQVTDSDDGSVARQPYYKLCKWETSDSIKCLEGSSEEDRLQKQKESNGPQLRQRVSSKVSGTMEKTSSKNEGLAKCDDKVQKERSKLLSMFGTLVSPKLRASQFSFETALETLVEVANKRTAMLASFDQIKKNIEGVNN